MNIFQVINNSVKYQKTLNIFTSKNNFSSISSSFKSKSRLTEFYKFVHPDVLGNAPEKVKEENLRSLKTLNMYLDALSQNQGVMDHQLNFYCSEKSNNKSKKYYYFQVRLNALRPDSPEDIIKKHMDSQIQHLIQGLKQTQEQINPYFKKAADKEREQLKQTQEKQSNSSAQNFDPNKVFKEDLSYKIDRIDKNKSEIDIMKDVFQKRQIQQQLFKNVMSYRNSKLKDQIQNELYFMDTPSNKPQLWSKIIMNDSQYLKDIHNVFQKLIDPRLIFLDHQLTNDQIEEFRANFVKSTQVEEQDFVTNLKILQNVFQDMESQNPQIPLYVTDKYGYEDIPGFFSIPYKFDCEQLEDVYSKLRDKILYARQYFDETTIKFMKQQDSLKQKFQFAEVIIYNSNTQEQDQQKKLLNLKQANQINTLDNNMLLVKQTQKLLTEIVKENQLLMNQLFNKQKLILGTKEFLISKFEIHIPLNFNLKQVKNDILNYAETNNLI